MELQILGELYSCKIEIYAYSKEPLFEMGATVQDDRVVRLSYHQNSHYNSVIRKDKATNKDWIIHNELGFLEDVSFAKLEARDSTDLDSKEPSPEMERLLNCGHTIEQIKSAIEASRRGFAAEFQRDLDSVLDESRRAYEESHAAERTEEEKAIEESKRMFENEQTEDSQIRQAIQNSLGSSVSPDTIPEPISQEQDEAQAAMLASAMSSLSLGAYNRNELSQNPIVQQAVALGKILELSI